MSLFAKSRTRINGTAFGEYALERIDRRLLLDFEDRVQASNNGTIEIPPQMILTVRGQGQRRSVCNLPEALIRDLYPFQPFRRRQVETEPQLDNGAGHERL